MSDAAVAAALPPLREVIRRHGLDARRSLGQHFLLDQNLTDRVARAAGPLPGFSVIEVGPGPGGLTRSLLACGAAHVVAIEKDRRCAAALGDLAGAFPGRLEVVEADALEVDVRALCPVPRKVVANLPYNIATPLLIGWLRQARDFASFTLMLQREVAQRLAATPGTAAYGRLTVLAQWLTDVEFQFAVDRRAFVPPPRVTSAVVNLIPRPEPLSANWRMLETVTQAAFGQRRKMLRSSLKSLGIDPAAVGIEPTRRAEELSVENFCALARLYARSRGAEAQHRGEPPA
ncbi:MAG: 16S rRNA (adenine(1518)-N(6)/adenine(1519)-N(6))-dimethyltransferase RsmA [Rhodospirillales bacterium]|jgi:16S rRNA (adenine1518-N6/adenine1519-N6)-dimethyltransferase|nr:16S rRNA (adenine(1518)-N(6)/adenine(1519)-N(6))-dimethyltransferase RsmA [Rhodospirillales bacterium]